MRMCMRQEEEFSCTREGDLSEGRIIQLIQFHLERRKEMEGKKGGRGIGREERGGGRGRGGEKGGEGEGRSQC